MSKLPMVRAREVVRVAEATGFVFDRQRGSHAVYFRLSDKKRVVIPMPRREGFKTGDIAGNH